jgi:hypothetical protein
MGFKQITPFLTVTKQFLAYLLGYHCKLCHIASPGNSREDNIFTHNQKRSLMFAQGRRPIADCLSHSLSILYELFS